MQSDSTSPSQDLPKMCSLTTALTAPGAAFWDLLWAGRPASQSAPSAHPASEKTHLSLVRCWNATRRSLAPSLHPRCARSILTQSPVARPAKRSVDTAVPAVLWFVAATRCGWVSLGKSRVPRPVPSGHPASQRSGSATRLDGMLIAGTGGNRRTCVGIVAVSSMSNARWVLAASAGCGR